MSYLSGSDPGAVLPRYRPRQLEKLAPCQGDCVSGGDVRGWIGVIAQRHRTGMTDKEAITEAWQLLTETNPFPGVLGRVCPHPCEAGCNRTGKDGPVAINALERFIGDWAIEHGLGFEIVGEERHPESIGVIGAGPSGLSFAYQMARRGYQVTIYEKNPQAGGMLRYGVPDYRLPPFVLDAEIQRILELGIGLHTGVAVGVDLDMDELRAAHEVLYVGIGAQCGRLLGLPSEEGAGMFTGIDYLGRVNRGEPVAVGARVVVVGGGNTAVDAARVARRAGAEVTILYRRTRAEMPAVEAEIDEAILEGVAMEFLAAPVEVVRVEGEIQKVTARRMKLGDPEADGRRRPVPIPDSEFSVDADTVIAAVSQVPDSGALQQLGFTEARPGVTESGEVSPGIWAGGDVLAADMAGAAILHGRRAALAAHTRLRNLDPPPPDGRPSISADQVMLDYKNLSPRSRGNHITVEEALSNPSAEVIHTLTQRQALTEVDRCFSCGSCMGCASCWMFCTVGSFAEVTISGPGDYFSLMLDQCEECGKCIEVCPCGYLEVDL
jgi:NADPH-dependent glutamate synthase beta subunit-like oxidoreductase/Pyruvate/2-oxoacid:ferredoxin oxidoreductase delta subunit